MSHKKHAFHCISVHTYNNISKVYHKQQLLSRVYHKQQLLSRCLERILMILTNIFPCFSMFFLFSKDTRTKDFHWRVQETNYFDMSLQHHHFKSPFTTLFYLTLLRHFRGHELFYIESNIPLNLDDTYNY